MTSATRRIQVELERQGGVLGALEALAEQVRESADTLAGFIQSVALEIDRERRGALSAVSRQDVVETASTILALLRDPLLDAEARQALRDRLVRELAPSDPRPVRKRREKAAPRRPRPGSLVPPSKV